MCGGTRIKRKTDWPAPLSKPGAFDGVAVKL